MTKRFTIDYNGTIQYYLAESEEEFKESLHEEAKIIKIEEVKDECEYN